MRNIGRFSVESKISTTSENNEKIHVLIRFRQLLLVVILVLFVMPTALLLTPWWIWMQPFGFFCPKLIEGYSRIVTWPLTLSKKIRSYCNSDDFTERLTYWLKEKNHENKFWKQKNKFVQFLSCGFVEEIELLKMWLIQTEKFRSVLIDQIAKFIFKWIEMMIVLTRLFSKKICYVLHHIDRWFTMWNTGIDSPFKPILFWMPLNSKNWIRIAWIKKNKYSLP